MAVKLDPRVLEELHTVLSIHVLREIELEVELKKSLVGTVGMKMAVARVIMKKEFLKQGELDIIMLTCQVQTPSGISPSALKKVNPNWMIFRRSTLHLKSCKKLKVKTSWMIFNQEQ